MASSGSSSSSSSRHVSPSASPETPKKVSKSPTSSPEASKVPRSPEDSPKTPKKVPKSPTSSPEASKVPRSPEDSPKTPKKVPKSPTSSPEASKVPRSPKEVPSSPPSSPKTPQAKKILPATPTASEVQESPVGTPEAPKETSKPPAGEHKVVARTLSEEKRFKSSLQVFLQRKQGEELIKSREYKAKLERGEIDDDDNDETEEAVHERERERVKEDHRKIEESKTKAEEGSESEEERERGTKVEPGNEKGRSFKKKGEENEAIKEGEGSEGKAKVMKREETVSKEVTEKIEEEEEEQEEEAERKTDKGKEDRKGDGGKEKNKEVKKEEKAKEGTKRKEERRETDAGREGGKEREEATKGRERDERLQGYLYLKRKRAFNPWKEYYFVLDGLLLTYYRSLHDYEHLGTMKGSLDLSLVEEVKEKKPNIMRTRHRFSFARFNRPSINLAAETREEQDRWVSVVQAVVGPRRQSLSCTTVSRSTDAGTSPPLASTTTKSATLPPRVQAFSSCGSSTDTEGEDQQHDTKEHKKVEGDEDDSEDKEAEDSELIKPKKVMRVPIGMPLVKVNLDQIKLKKVERKEVSRENVEESKVGDASASPHSTPRPGNLTKEPSSSEVFGVILKKTKRKEEEEEEKESPRETGGGREGSVSPGNRRPSRQAVIPLNNRKLLLVPDVKEAKSPKTSPLTSKRPSVERRKSPSPSLPISKSVQALTKSAEEVKEMQEDHVSAADSTTGKGKEREVKVCHAHTSEVKYSDVVDVLHVEEVAEVKVEENEEQIQDKKVEGENEDEAKEDVGEKHKTEEDMKKVLSAPPLKVDEEEKEDNDEGRSAVPSVLKNEMPEENTSVEDSANDDNICRQQAEAATEDHKKGCISSIEDETGKCEAPQADASPESCHVATPLTPPASPASSSTSTDSETVPKSSLSSPPSSEPIPSSPKPDPPYPEQTPSPDPQGCIRKVEEDVEHTTTPPLKLKTDKTHQQQPQEEADVVLSYPPRHRTCTNESSASSSCLEGGEKKSSKFKFLNKLKGGASLKEKEKKEEAVVQKEPKERKRRGSNALSVLLQGKKTKEGGCKKVAGEEPQALLQQDTHESLPMSPHQATTRSESPPTKTEASPFPVVAPVNVQVTPPPAPQPPEEEQPQDQLDAGAEVTLRTETSDAEVRVSVHSYTSSSSRDDPPPSIPEKTNIRAHSPNHDVPMNNRPVSNIHDLVHKDEDEEEDEASPTLDGYITEEQIEALLRSQEKRKPSLSRSQASAKPDVVNGMPSSSLSTEDWASRPPYSSFSSIDSDEPLAATNFLSFGWQSSSSGSIGSSKGLAKGDRGERLSFTRSDSGESQSLEVEVPAEPLRRAPRATDAIAAKNRVSLTSPEFTVKEEEALSSPETAKARPNKDKNTEKEQHDDDESEAKAEKEDFFPVVGGDVQLRPPLSVELPTADFRTSGIVGLKEFLRESQEEDLPDVKSGISRLGHSAAIEKLKQTDSEQ